MPETPDVIVSITRYTVSVLPADDINHKVFALQVELKPRGWVVHNGHEYFGPDGGVEYSESTAHMFADYDDALALAKELAPRLNVMGRTATEVYHRTRNTEESMKGQALDEIQDCRCVEFCYTCSMSGRRHVHPASEHPEYGPCPVHPGAPGDH